MTAIERELIELKTRLQRLEAEVYGIATQEETLPQSPTLEESFESEQVLTWLKTEGLIRLPTLEEKHLAAEWDTLPEDEKQAHIYFMQHLLLDPPLSKSIIENRQ